MLQDIIAYCIVGAAFLYCLFALLSHFLPSGKSANKCASCTAECPIKNLRSASPAAGGCPSCGTSNPARPSVKTCSHYQKAVKSKADAHSHKARPQ